MTTLVGPLPTVRFRDGTKVAYQPPRDTTDGGRWKACAEHRVACDCREAEMAERIAELTAQLREVEDAAREILAGHPTYAWEENHLGVGQRDVGCACTGCRVVRAASLLSVSEFGPSARDQVDGLDGESIDYGMRWKPCTLDLRAEHPEVCAKGATRDRGVYHEHLRHGDGWPVGLDRNEECPF